MVRAHRLIQSILCDHQVVLLTLRFLTKRVLLASHETVTSSALVLMVLLGGSLLAIDIG